MDIQRIKTVLLIILALSTAWLMNAWFEPKVPSNEQVVQSTEFDVPTIQGKTEGAFNASDVSNADRQALVRVETDVLTLKINPQGGDVVFAALNQYDKYFDDDKHEPVVLLDEAINGFLQTGLAGELGPDFIDQPRATYQVAKNNYELIEEGGSLQVPLLWKNQNGLHVEKVFTFYPGSYRVDIDYHVKNTGAQIAVMSPYAQWKNYPQEKKSSGFGPMNAFQGGAYGTATKPYQKISFDKMSKKPVSDTFEGNAWIALQEHYFVGAWVPETQAEKTIFSKSGSDGSKILGLAQQTQRIQPGDTQDIHATLFFGPKKPALLKEAAPGLELSVDYGILWPIAQGLFWLIENIYRLVGNWGWSIILLTLFVKAAFFKLSATSYSSMARMRKLQPQIEQLKSDCGDDKARFSQAMMQLYRDKKVNPMSGCLPLIVQIPVFISLYYVLLTNVELRHSPFIFWIQDLSAKDPFYVLPLIMGASMLIQQKLSPAPADPMQAKLMMFMPVMFTALFMQFPAGLVLYWVANNVLSILQQWYITRKV